MKKRKFKILKTNTTMDKSGGTIIVFHTKVGPFRYFLSNATVLKRFLMLNPKLLPKDDAYFDLKSLVGRFLFVPERSK